MIRVDKHKNNIHCSQLDLLVGGVVAEKLLDNILAIVECAGNSQVVDVLLGASSHLCLLDGTDTTLGVQDGDRNILLAPESVDSSRSSVTTGGANDREVVSILSFLADILLGEQVLEKVSKELQSAILERVGGTVEDLKQVDVAI